MFKFIVQFLIFFACFQRNRKSKGSLLTPSGVLFGIYLIGSLCGIGTLYVEEFTDPFRSTYWWPMLLFDVLVLLFLLPFKTFNECQTKQIVLPNISVLNAISTILIALSLFSIIYDMRTVINVFSTNLNEARMAVAAGESMYADTGLLNTIASVSSSFYVYVLILFFIYTAIGGHKTRRVLLLISSFSAVIQVLTFVGRDGVVFWLFMFLFCYSFFHPFMPTQARKGLKKTFLRALIIISIPFLMITVSRFSSSSIGANGSMVSYMGQGFVNGPLLFGIPKEQVPFTHGASFPLFYEITGIHKMDGPGLVEVGEWKSWTFPTFVGSFYRNFGMGGLIVFCIFAGFVFYRVLGSKRISMKLNHIIIYSLFFLIYSEGVFYFREYTRGGNLFILLCLFFSIVLPALNLEAESPVVLIRNKEF